MGELAQRLGMQKVIYFFNLNDILPDAVAAGKQTTPLTRLQHMGGPQSRLVARAKLSLHVRENEG